MKFSFQGRLRKNLLITLNCQINLLIIIRFKIYNLEKEKFQAIIIKMMVKFFIKIDLHKLIICIII